MDAVSGTSVGALNAILFATGNIPKGKQMWETLTQDDVLPFRYRPPLRWFSLLLLFPHMIASFRAGWRAWVDPGPARNIVETIIFLIHFIPVFAIGVLAFGEAGLAAKGGLALLAFWIVSVCIWLPKNESPRDFRVLQAMLNSLHIPVAKLILVAGFARHAYLVWRIEPVPTAVPVLWISCLVMLLILRGSIILLPLSFTDHSPLRKRIREILQAPLRCPTYATLTEHKAVIDADFPHWEPVMAQPGDPILYRAVPVLTYIPRYFKLNDLTEPDRSSAVLASTALPFGITPRVTVGSTSYVDGGMADNLPIRPLVDLEACDVVIWMRINPEELPEAENREASHPDPRVHWQRTWRREDALEFEAYIDPTDDPTHPEIPTHIPWRTISDTFPNVLLAVPATSLGGVLDFDRATQEQRFKLGEAMADDFLRKYQAVLEPLIAAAREETLAKAEKLSDGSQPALG